MQAKDIMTKKVVSVGVETPLREVVRVLIAHSISAVPVLDPAGKVVGMVSEDDLMDRNDEQREARRDRWLALLQEGAPVNPAFLATFRNLDRPAREVIPRQWSR